MPRSTVDVEPGVGPPYARLDALHRGAPATDAATPDSSHRLFGALPAEGPWTSLSLTGAQFFGILAASCVLFLLWGGPLWSHLGGQDLGRLAVSYALIPVATGIALHHNAKLSIGSFLGASSVIAVLKLVVTAGVDLILGIAFGVR